MRKFYRINVLLLALLLLLSFSGCSEKVVKTRAYGSDYKAEKAQDGIVAENEHFEEHRGVVYRCGEVYRRIIDPRTGNCIKKQLIRRNHAKVMYDTSHLHPIHIP